MPTTSDEGRAAGVFDVKPGWQPTTKRGEKTRKTETRINAPDGRTSSGREKTWQNAY